MKIVIGLSNWQVIFGKTSHTIEDVLKALVKKLGDNIGIDAEGISSCKGGRVKRSVCPRKGLIEELNE